MADKMYAAVSGSMTKIRAEQIKGEDASLITLAGELAAIKGQIADIIGDASYKAEVPAAVQLSDLARHLDASAADSGTLEILNDLNVQETADFDGAVSMQSTLTVEQGTTLKNGLTVNTAVADFNAGVTANEIKIDGDVADRLYLVGASGQIEDSAGLVYASSKLSVTGIVSGSAALQGASMAVDGAATIGNGVTVNGAVADFNAGVTANQIKIDGDTAQRLYIVGAAGELVDEANLNFNGTKLFVTGGLDVSAAARFGDDVTIVGNLTINGTTTTVNSTTLTVDDKNLELGSVNTPSDVTAAGGGITLKGATDKTIIWNDSSKGWEFNQSISGSGAARFAGSVSAPEMKIDGDVADRLYLVGASGQIEDSAGLVYASSKLSVTGIVSGSGALQGASLSVAGAAAAGSMAISGDVAQRLYIVDADGTMKDESKLVFDGAKLAVTGMVSGSAALNGASLLVDGLAEAGQLRVAGVSRFQGQVRLDAAAVVSGSVVPSVASVFNVGSVDARYSNVFAGTADLNATGATPAIDLTGASHQLIRKAGSGDLMLSSSVAAGYIKFDDAFRGAQLLNSATSGLKLANSGEWATFATSYPTVDSILGAFNAIAAGSGAEKAFFVAGAGVAAVAAVDVTAGSGMADLNFAGLTKDNSMVFFNGQMLRSGSVADLAAPATADYSFDGGKASVKFAFAVETGDQLVVQKL